MHPGPGLRAIAISSAAITNSLRMWLAIPQPTIRRLNRPRTCARYSHPSTVQT